MLASERAFDSRRHFWCPETAKQGVRQTWPCEPSLTGRALELEYIVMALPHHGHLPQSAAFQSLVRQSVAACDCEAPAAPKVELRVPAFFLKGIWDELARRGVARSELEHASGVGCPRSGDFLSTLSAAEIDALFEAAVALTGDESLGLTVGRAMSCASLHLVGHVILASASFRQAIMLLSKLGPEWPRPVIEGCGEGRLRLGFDSDGASTVGSRVRGQITGFALHDIAAQFASRAILSVELDFPAPADTTPYLQAFPGGVRFDAAGTFVILPGEALARRRNGASSSLTDQLFRLAQDHYGSSDAERNWTSRVRRALRVHVAPRLTDPERLAGQFGISSRALGRRLKREGVTLSQLVDEILYERARSLLARPGATCAQVAESLGYAELSSFSRAFRRWSGGKTPGAAVKLVRREAS